MKQPTFQWTTRNLILFQGVGRGPNSGIAHYYRHRRSQGGARGPGSPLKSLASPLEALATPLVNHLGKGQNNAKAHFSQLKLFLKLTFSSFCNFFFFLFSSAPLLSTILTYFIISSDLFSIQYSLINYNILYFWLRNVFCPFYEKLSF